jgi:hypothetical protein
MKRLVALFLTLTLLGAHEEVLDRAQNVWQGMHYSSYDHKAFIDETSGVYRVDCSSFLGFIIGKISKEAYDSLPIDTPHKRPRAKNFYDYFHALDEHEKQGGWMGIKRIFDLEKGDIIAWKYDPSLGKKDTGHVVMVYEKPILEKDGRYKVRVMDSSKGKHAEDSRGENQSGIGVGTMWFRVDSEGVPNGLYWSERSPKISEHAIAMGRVTP